MISKRLSTILLAISISFTPATRVLADAGDFVAGALIGGIVGHVATKEAQRKKQTTQRQVYRQRIPSTQEGRDIQASLNYFGFDAGRVDGQLGRKSRNAISQYQAYLGYPVTGQLTPYEQNLLISSYNRAQFGGTLAVRQAMVHPEGTRSLLKTYRAELAGVAPEAAAPVDAGTTLASAPEPKAPAEAPAAALPNFLGADAPKSLASHCNTISLLTNTNGGFTTEASMTDPNFTLNEQFCLARTYAIALGEDMASKVQGVSMDQIEAQCAGLGPAMKDFVSALSLKSHQEVVQDVTAFVLTTGMSPAQLKATAQICLGVGYRKDDMDVALGSALLIYALGEGVYGELMGHHLAQGFGTTKRTDMALAWYAKGLEAVEAGAVPVFAPGQPERTGLLRKASLQLGGAANAGSSAATVQPASTLPSFSVAD